MKRFDKGYIYSGLLSDLFSSFVIVFIFLEDFFLNEEVNSKDITAVMPYLFIAFILVYFCFICYRILYYKTSGYELTETEIKCNRGVLFRKRSVLDYKKIHAINKKQSLFNRIFGISVLTVDSGSTNTSNQAEITIIEKDSVVDALLDELNRLKTGDFQNENKNQSEVLLSENDSLYCFTSKKKMLYTLINIVSTSFFTALFGALAIISIGACKLLLKIEGLGTWGQYFLTAALITVVAMLLLSVFVFIICMIQSFVAYHNFAITKKGNDIQISFGLFERHTNTFSYDRIKAVKISQGLVQRMLGFASIKLEVIGYTNNSGDDNISDLGVLVPFCKYDEVGIILSKVLPDYVPEQNQTKAAAYFPFISWYALIITVITVIVLLMTVIPMIVFNVSYLSIVLFIFAVVCAYFVILIIKSIGAFLSYKTNGISINNGKITAYSGGFTKTITVFMSKNLVAAENVTTPLRKKAGITSLVMQLKTNAFSNEIKVHIQQDALSNELEELLII